MNLSPQETPPARSKISTDEPPFIFLLIPGKGSHLVILEDLLERYWPTSFLLLTPDADTAACEFKTDEPIDLILLEDASWEEQIPPLLSSKNYKSPPSLPPVLILPPSSSESPNAPDWDSIAEGLKAFNQNYIQACSTKPLYDTKLAFWAGVLHHRKRQMPSYERLRSRLAKRTAELEKANAELKRVAKLKDEFLANMSHELRTPLSAILGLAETLAEGIYGPLSPRQQKAIQEITESGNHLLELINGILDLSKIQAGRLEVHPQPVDLIEICHASVNMVRELAKNKGFAIKIKISAPELWVYTDAFRLKQILVNLLSNAIKFTPPGGEVGIDIESHQGDIMIAVWDTGIGINPELVPRLFEPFVQLDGELSRRFDGTGLGLALVSRLAELLKIELTVESELGKGSRFTLKLPSYAKQRSDNHQDIEAPLQ